MSSIKKILFLIDYKYSLLVFLLSLFIFISFLEIFSLALLIPFLSLITDENNLNPYLLSFATIFIENIDKSKLIVFFGLIILFVIIIKSIITIFCWYLVYYFTWENVISLRIRLIDIYKQINYEKYVKKTSSEYIQNVTVISANFTKQTLLPLMQIVSDVILTFSIAVFLLVTDVYIFISLCLIILLFSIIFDTLLKKRLTSYGMAINKNAIIVLNSVKNLFQGYKEVKIYNKSNYFKETIYTGSKNFANYQIKSQVFQRLPREILEIVFAILVLTILFIFFVFNEYEFTKILPTLVIFVVASRRIAPAAASINIALNTLRIGKFSLDKMYAELNELNNINKNNFKKNKLDKFQYVSFNNVSYSYPDKKEYALEDISFDIKKGEIIGIFGNSGAGKTTCVDLLLGFLSPSKGNIFYNNNILLDDNNIDDFQNKIGYIPQDIFIINDSIKNNIILSSDDTNKIDRVNQSIKTTNLDSFISKQVEGLETFLGDNGLNISGGQRQRISLARAIFHNREILILDEATNALDEKTERKIINEIKLMKNKKTIIIISHNSKILDICDKIIIIENSKIKKINTYEEIFNKGRKIT